MFEDLEEKYNIKHYVKNAVLVSYPKSGRTWLRMILARLLVNMGESCEEYEMLPSLHQYPDWMISNYPNINNAKVILLHRHPGDVVVSYHADHVSLDGQCALMDFSEFLRDDKWGALRNINFNNWWVLTFMEDPSFYNRAIEFEIKTASSQPPGKRIAGPQRGAKSTENVSIKQYMIISYEHMKRDTFGVVKEIAKFLEIDGCTDEHIREAIEYSKFENMKKIELGEDPELPNLLDSYKGQFGKMENIYEKVDGELVLLEAKKNVRVRVGKVRNYLNVLSAEDIKYIHDTMEKHSILSREYYEKF